MSPQCKELILTSIFVVKQLMYENDSMFARIDCEAVFSSFEAAHTFMREKLCPEDLCTVDLECYRNEIVELPLGEPILAGWLSKKVYLPTGELHLDYDKIEEWRKPKGEVSRADPAVGDLVRFLPDYQCPGANLFEGGFGVVFGLPDSEMLAEGQCPYCYDDENYKTYYITSDGKLVRAYACKEELVPLAEPLYEELEFLVVLSDHFLGKKPLSDEMLEWLTSDSSGPLYLRKRPVYDFSTGTILKTWVADGSGQGGKEQLERPGTD